MACSANDVDEAEVSTFTGKAFTRWVDEFAIGPGCQLYACVYRDFGEWRPVADYRTKDRIIKLASQRLFADRSSAAPVADELVGELMRLVGVEKRRI